MEWQIINTVTTTSVIFIVLMDVTEYLSNFRTYFKSQNPEFVKAAAVQNLDSLGLKEQESRIK